MEHLAILNKKLNLLPKILIGKKTIESRWYKFKKDPYQNISSGEIVYFKNSGEPVSVKAMVEKVLFFENLDNAKIKDLLEVYGSCIGVDISYLENLTGKNYCTLIFLKDVEEIKPFEIDKKGYGNMAAWITLDSIETIKKNHL